MNFGPAARESFSRDDRLRKRREFEECYSRGVRVSGRHLQIFLLSRAGARQRPRIGISVPRRAGGAVVRNRLRRRLREIFRRHRDALPSQAAVIVVNVRPSAASASFLDLAQDYLSSIARGRTRLGRP